MRNCPFLLMLAATPITVGADQVQALLATTQQPSNRPVQPLNGGRIEQVAAQP